MQVNSIGLNNTNFGNIEKKVMFAELSDNDLRKIAYKQASIDVNDKKHKRLNDALYYSVPVVSGIAAAVTHKASRIGRVGNFGLGFASWAIPFAIVDAVIGTKHIAQNIAPSVKEFSDKHPMTTLIGTLAATIAAYAAVTRGGMKALNKYGEQIAKKSVPYVEKLSKQLEGSKVLDKLAAVTNKIPSSAKDISKIALNWAPWVLLLTNISHSVNHEVIKGQEFVNNYEKLKDKQEQVRNELIAED